MSISTPRRASTPIRGVSSGSFTVTRAQSDAPTPLSFLQDDALPILVEETMTLHDNFAQISEIQHAMTAFNESFAAFLYGIKMNAFCVEWPEAPTEATLRAQVFEEQEEDLQPKATRKTSRSCGMLLCIPSVHYTIVRYTNNMTRCEQSN